MSINSRVPASGEFLKTDGTIINRADVLADVYDAINKALRVVLQAEGVTFEVNEADLTAVREAVEGLAGATDTQPVEDSAVVAAIGLVAKLTDTQPIKINDDAFAIVSAPVVKRQSVATTASQIVLTDDAGEAIEATDISAIRIHNIGVTDLYIGTVSTLTTADKSDRVSPDGEITFSFQHGSSAASALWLIRDTATEDVAITIVRRA